MSEKQRREKERLRKRRERDQKRREDNRRKREEEGRRKRDGGGDDVKETDRERDRKRPSRYDNNGDNGEDSDANDATATTIASAIATTASAIATATAHGNGNGTTSGTAVTTNDSDDENEDSSLPHKAQLGDNSAGIALDGGRMMCAVCQRTFANNYNLQRHMPHCPGEYDPDGLIARRKSRNRSRVSETGADGPLPRNRTSVFVSSAELQAEKEKVAGKSSTNPLFWNCTKCDEPNLQDAFDCTKCNTVALREEGDCGWALTRCAHLTSAGLLTTMRVRTMRTMTRT